jgi:hypothetical protein
MWSREGLQYVVEQTERSRLSAISMAVVLENEFSDIRLDEHGRKVIGFAKGVNRGYVG